MVLLELGCGRTKRVGFIGLDVERFRGVDVLCDLNMGIPLRDSCVDEVYSSHCMEHLINVILVLKEIMRVSKNGAVVTLRVPFWSHECAMLPGHVHTVSPLFIYYVVGQAIFEDGTVRPCPDAKTNTFGDYPFSLELLNMTYNYRSEGLAVCRKLGLSPEEGLRFLNNIVYDMEVQFKVVK